VDWVTNPITYCSQPQQYLIDPVDGVVGFPLTIADKWRLLEAGSPGFESETMTWTAVPEGALDKTVAVRGQCQLEAQTWAIGTRFNVAMRIAVCTQDGPTLGAVLDPLYMMGVNTPGALLAYNEANERFCWERKYVKEFNTNAQSVMNVDVNASCKRRLKPDQALYMLVECYGTRILFTPWLRTLCEV